MRTTSTRRLGAAAAALGAALLVSLAFGAGAANASTTTSTLTPDQVAALQAKMDTYGVPAAQQDGLIAKIEAGQPLDADTGAAPVSTSTVTIGYENETVERYADGSFAATVTPDPSATSSSHLIQPLATDSITGCTRSTGAGVTVYSGCTVKRDTLQITLSFKVTYHVAAATTQIESIGAQSTVDIQCAGGTCTLNTYKITEKTATSNYKATALLKVYAVGIAGSSSSYPYLQFNLSAGGATSLTHNF
ncbi:hypothetical protein D7I44_17890 (plasmid) [Gryllotalpicola protaetiae]|uniref:Tat pathway signal sequence domain protein n=2 Tax=Gryllotalpicola protaetiae TaxID=2419771 RepID=A0A387BXD3_9MICO|nr:hypothetical protein D7I44_17890 [Gryllotalpicola protaetiae]